MTISCGFLLAGWIEDIPTNAYVIRAFSSTVLFLWCLIVTGLVGALVMLHSYLIFVGKTTSEFFRERRHKSSDSNSGTKSDKSAPSDPIDYILAAWTPIERWWLSSITAVASLFKRKSYTSINAQQGSTSPDSPLSATRLLPMWQFENVEDIFMQDDLTDTVMERYNQLKVELATPGSPSTSPLISPDIPPSHVHDSYLRMGDRISILQDSNSDFTPLSPQVFERTALRTSDSFEHKEDDENQDQKDSKV